MQFLKSILKISLGLFLIISLMNLSIQIWNTSMLFAEINEEIENVLDDEIANEALVNDGSGQNSIANISLRDYRNHHPNQFSNACEYFEIDSPPPELV